MRSTAIRRRLEVIGSEARLEVDGGVSTENILELWEAGADSFVAAHAIFGHPDGIPAGLQALRKTVNGQTPAP